MKNRKILGFFKRLGIEIVDFLVDLPIILTVIAGITFVELTVGLGLPLALLLFIIHVLIPLYGNISCTLKDNVKAQRTSEDLEEQNAMDKSCKADI